MSIWTRDLFGSVVPIRQEGYIQPRGYVGRPGAGPTGEQCKTCAHKIKMGGLFKCGKNRPAWTKSRRTDILVASPACQFWEGAGIV